MVVLILIIITAMAVPQILSTLYWYRLDSAVASVVWAVQSTRYEALMEGYPYQVTFSATNNTYQLASDPTNSGNFGNVGSSIPISGSGITLSGTNAIQFKPYGFVTPGANSSLSFQIKYQGLSKTVAVSNYGNVTVTSP